MSLLRIITIITYYYVFETGQLADGVIISFLKAILQNISNVLKRLCAVLVLLRLSWQRASLYWLVSGTPHVATDGQHPTAALCRSHTSLHWFSNSCTPRISTTRRFGQQISGICFSCFPSFWIPNREIEGPFLGAGWSGQHVHRMVQTLLQNNSRQRYGGYCWIDWPWPKVIKLIISIEVWSIILIMSIIVIIRV